MPGLTAPTATSSPSPAALVLVNQAARGLEKAGDDRWRALVGESRQFVVEQAVAVQISGAKGQLGAADVDP